MHSCVCLLFAPRCKMERPAEVLFFARQRALQYGASGGAKIGPARYPFTAWWQHGLARAPVGDAPKPQIGSHR
jgi:hypothetical protein